MKRRARQEDMRHAVHVIPIHDLREHEESGQCWCGPRVTTVEAIPPAGDGRERWTHPLVVHHSLDGRELIELHGLQ